MNKDQLLEKFIYEMNFSLENLPNLVVVKDTNSLCMTASNSLCSLTKVNKKYFFQRSDDDLPWCQFADIYRNSDKVALSGKITHTFQPVQFNRHTSTIAKISRYPIIDKSNNIIGLVGDGYFLHEDQWTTQVIKTLFKTNSKITAASALEVSDKYSDISFTKREIECLFFILRNKSAKEIGKFLQISSRTVEDYIEKIKIKTGAQSKNQIIDKALELKLFDILPSHMLLQQIFKKPDQWHDFLKP